MTRQHGSRPRAKLRSTIAALLVLASCETAEEGAPAHELAQQCVAIEAAATGGMLSAGRDGRYRFADLRWDEAGAFFAKPSGLGTFLLYDADGSYLGADDGTVVRRAEADDDAEWAVRALEIRSRGDVVAAHHTLVSTKRDRRLVVAGNAAALRPSVGRAIVDAAAMNLVALPAERCRAFPEAALDATVAPSFPAPRDPDAPAVGFADLHAHFGFPEALAGVTMAGGVFHRFGIEHALGDCARLHGPDGSWDLLGGQGGDARHATDGYPTFTDWPVAGSTSHVQAYHRWMERAYLSGLRLAVTDATGNPALCQLLSALRPKLAERDCSPVATVERQTRYMYALQDYVDAQAGGPGQGWLRVVTSPAEARAVIAENKLAVVLGVEYSTLFDCRVGRAWCTEEYVDRQLRRLRALGVRSVFPIHRFDNAFGGTRPGSGPGDAWMNLTNKLATGRVDHVVDLIRPRGLLFEPLEGSFWELEECPEGMSGIGRPYDMRRFLAEEFPSLGEVPDEILDVVLFDKLEPVPDYAEFEGGRRACNPRSLTPIGRHLIERLMDLGMIVEVDHMSNRTLLDALELLEARDYPGVVSSHSWLEDRPEIRERILRLGGMMSPMTGGPSSTANRLAELAAEQQAHGSPNGIGVAIGSDIQGVRGQPGGDPQTVTAYPFISYDGRVTFHRPRTGERTFDFATEGMAHYGLFPEWVEGVRQVDEDHPADVMEILMGSAEAYLRMWERATTARTR